MWDNGSINVYGSTFEYGMKVHEERSPFGIDGGKVSKLMIKCNGKIVCNYDKGWDIKPSDPNTQLAMELLLHSNNY